MSKLKSYKKIKFLLFFKKYYIERYAQLKFLLKGWSRQEEDI